MFSVQKTHAARMLRDDLERAGISAFKPGEGIAVFHSLRMSFCSLLDEHGASAKANQELARHSTPVITMNTYVRVKQERVRGVVEALGETVLCPIAAGPEVGHSRMNTTPQMLTFRFSSARM